MTRYQITRSYPDGVDEDYRIDGFDIAGLGYRSLEATIALYDAGISFWTGSVFNPAEVIARVHPVSRRRYLTTVPDGYRVNNLSGLAHVDPHGAMLRGLMGLR